METINLTPRNFTFATLGNYNYNGVNIVCTDRKTGFGSGKKTVYTCVIDGITHADKDITYYKRLFSVATNGSTHTQRATKEATKEEPKQAEQVKKATRNSVIRHAEFEHICDLVNRRQHVYLYGPAGTGKSALAKQIANELNLPFAYATSLFDIYALEGFISANGVYKSTPFYDAYMNGGVFLLDELDNSAPEVLKKLNGALSNGCYAFPCGMVEMHKDFICIATGNTIGKGATEEYTANVMDASSLNRFTGKIEINYDVRVERAISKGDNAIVDFVEECRKSAKRAGQRILLSYREIEAVTAMRDIWTPAEIVKYILFPTMSEDDRNTLCANYNGDKSNTYFAALKNA